MGTIDNFIFLPRNGKKRGNDVPSSSTKPGRNRGVDDPRSSGKEQSQQGELVWEGGGRIRAGPRKCSLGNRKGIRDHVRP